MLLFISESPMHSSKTKHLVTDQRLRWSSDPSSVTAASRAECMWVLKTYSAMEQLSGWRERLYSTGFWMFLIISELSRWSWVRILTWPYSWVESNRKHIKWVTILKRDSAKGEIRMEVKVSLVGFPYYLHCCRKLSRACAVQIFFSFTEFYKIC